MPKVIISHPKMYFTVAGKKQHCEVDTEIELSDKQIERLGKKVKTLKEAKSVKVDSKK